MLGFFKGLSLTGYLVGALCIALAGSTAFGVIQTKRVGSLQRELGISQAAIETLTEVNVHNRKQVISLEREIRDCAEKTAAVEGRAANAERELSRRLRETFKSTNDRVEKIKREVSGDSCSCTVPSRATELLIEAARSANRGSDGP